MRIRGEKDRPMNEDGLVTPQNQTLLFYPSSTAAELNSEFVEKLTGPVTLVVPDGSWRQAGKVMNRVEALRSVVHVKLPEGPIPRLRLRKESKVGGLSTFEAVARAIGLLESPEAQAKMEAFYKILAERTLWSRAKLTLQECETEIPRSALYR